MSLFKSCSTCSELFFNSVTIASGYVSPFYAASKGVQILALSATIGNADERFEEDALRILRMIRFSSLGFNISENDKEFLNRSVELLKKLKEKKN